MGWIGNAPSQGLFNGGQIVDGTVDTVDLKDGAVTASKMAGTLDLSSKTLTLPEEAVTEHVEVTSQAVIDALGYTPADADDLTPAQISDKPNTSTGYFELPAGTTEQRPANPTGRMIRKNTTTGYIEYYDPIVSDWVGIGAFSAIGGTVSDISGYRYHVFTASGTFTVTAGSKSVEYMLVGGGGGGGSHMGGGGGGGGVVTGSVLATSGSYTVTVGSGGAGGTGNSGGVAGKGNNSIFSSATALGGGGGSNGPSTGTSGASGASGGGNTGWSTDGLAGGAGTTGQGYAGGATVYGNSPEYLGTGGGGYSSAGTSGTIDPNYCGNGGSGYSVPTGYSTAYGRSTCAGGGGGGGVYTGYSEPVYGGTGTAGGGNGAGWTNQSTPNGTSTPGATNSGGGGGAARYDNLTGENGGSGIVIIRYQV